MEKKTLIIIGSGPAALTAAIYAARAKLQPVVFEGFQKGGISGGQLMTTLDVENFPGFPEKILGPDLIARCKKQAKQFGTVFVPEDVISVDLSASPFTIEGSKTKMVADAVIIATGAKAQRLDIPGAGDHELWQKGISSCATCDGASPIFRDKELFIVGGGDTAMEEALFLTKFAKKVTVVHRRDELRASKALAEKAKKHSKIAFLYSYIMTAIQGKDYVEKVVVKNLKTNKEEELSAGGVFFAIGHKPNTGFLKDQLQMNKLGYIMTQDKSSKTSVEGVFAAGDVQDPIYRQAITAAGSGCIAAIDVERWLVEKG